MAISSGIAIKFKEDSLKGLHDFTSAEFKIALYTSIASLSNGTSVYITSGQVANGNGYATGGKIVTVIKGFQEKNESLSHLSKIIKKYWGKDCIIIG